MAQAFDCLSCGAHLAASCKYCPACNRTIAVSHELPCSSAGMDNSRLSPETLSEIMGYIGSHQKALAIKRLRAAAGIGLDEAKEAVEGAERSLKSGGAPHGEPEAILAQVAISLPIQPVKTAHFPQALLWTGIAVLIVFLAIFVPMLLMVWK